MNRYEVIGKIVVHGFFLGIIYCMTPYVMWSLGIHVDKYFTWVDLVMFAVGYSAVKYYLLDND